MTSRPILFSGPMVRALLDVTKTQTRRAVKPQPTVYARAGADALARLMLPHCPYGKPGDLLWVRETWVDLLAVSPATDQPMPIGDGERLIEAPTFWLDDQGRKRWNYDGKVIAYRANSDVEFCDGNGFGGDMADKDDMPRWRPSIHMPRWASRLTLRITDVRVQRLQGISEADAIAEGIERRTDCPGWNRFSLAGDSFAIKESGAKGSVPTSFPKLAYRSIWEHINGPESWDANPWVWAISFEVLRANVDDAIRAMAKGE